MASYRISEDAKTDLGRIYRRGIHEILPGYRRSVCGVDSIYYRVIDDVVEIMRILGRQDADGRL